MLFGVGRFGLGGPGGCNTARQAAAARACSARVVGPQGQGEGSAFLAFRLPSGLPTTTISVPAFMTHQCGKAARDATFPRFHAAWLSVRCIPSMGGSVFGNSTRTSAAVPCPSWTHGLMVEPRARQDFQTLVLGIGICIHRLGHRYVPRPGRPLTPHFLSLRVSTGWWPPGFDPPAARPDLWAAGGHGAMVRIC